MKLAKKGPTMARPDAARCQKPISLINVNVFPRSQTARAGHPLLFQTHNLVLWYSQSQNDWPCQCQRLNTQRPPKMAVSPQKDGRGDRPSWTHLGNLMSLDWAVKKLIVFWPCSNKSIQHLCLQVHMMQERVLLNRHWALVKLSLSEDSEYQNPSNQCFDSFHVLMHTVT